MRRRLFQTRRRNELRLSQLTLNRKSPVLPLRQSIPPEAELETIVVAAESQRRGIAGLLFQELIAELAERQIFEVTLEVRESNEVARAFYRSLGFVESGRRRAYYACPQEDALLLRRRAWGNLSGPSDTREN